jgi:glycosyltransferase involved in cell wall biosynthesis
VTSVSVVVPTRDRPSPLRQCLAALAAQSLDGIEIVVVDDASDDGNAIARAVAEVPNARLVRGEGRGPAAARNAGAAAAAGEVVCFTDDDCRPEPQWADALRRRIERGADAVAGPTANGRPDDAYATASQAITNHLTDTSLGPDGAVGFAPTSNVACRTELLRRIPFDESYPLAAGEDRDWCDRVVASGATFVFEPAAVVRHHQDLSLRRFWHQQARYGRGAHHYRQTGTRQPPRFYLDLLRAGFRHGIAPGALVVVAQVATTVGFATEARAAARRSSPTSTPR